MARTGKTGLSYFSHDVDILQDKKIKVIKAKHGLIGYAVFLRLLEELYRDNGYFLEIDEDFNILFADDSNLEINAYINILNDCINKKLFDLDLFNSYSILTSKRIQENYLAGVERRKEVILIKEYLLLDPEEELSGKKVNVNINPLDVNINSLNADIGTQSKVKESKEKEKERKEEEKEQKENASDEAPPPPKKSKPKKINSVNEITKDILQYLNDSCGVNYMMIDTHCSLIQARLEKYTPDQCKQVIDNKVAEWGSDAKMQKFLRPSTLFQKKRFDEYLNTVNLPTRTEPKNQSINDVFREVFGDLSEETTELKEINPIN